MADVKNRNDIFQDGWMDQGRLVGCPDGLDSYSHPMMLKPTQYRWGVNCVNKGSIVQCRPGYDQRLAFDITIDPFKSWWNSVGNPPLHPQMFHYFESSYGVPQFVFAIPGSIWTTNINIDGSLQTPVLVSSQPFNQYAQQLVGCACMQTGTVLNGVYSNNIQPRNVLIIQDGVNRPGIWDGSSLYIANPTKAWTTITSGVNSGSTLFTDGFNETRIGMWMCWSGNRLWISNGPNVFGSDLGDPTHFTEEVILNSGGAWTFPCNVTGLFDRGLSGTTNSELFVFTNSSTWTLASGVQQRFPNSSTGAGGWIQTPNFQSKIFSGVGCVAGKSIIVHRGLIYWMSEDGLVVFDSYGTLFSTQNLPPIDQEMAYSKRLVQQDASMACAGYMDSYVFWSVPVGQSTNGRPYNGHTQVLDRQTTIVRAIGLNGPYAYGTIGWQGVWTGIRPVEWALSFAYRQQSPYALSMDLDGVPRIWEAFKGNRCDNGQVIPWTVETRQHVLAESLFETVIFRTARVALDEILGNLGMTILWRGTRGAYKTMYQGSFTATPGSIMLQTPVGTLPSAPGQPPRQIPQFTPYTNDTAQQNNTVQTRVVRTPDIRGVQPILINCSSAGVENAQEDQNDRAFSLVFQMTGRAAILTYRLQADQSINLSEGTGIEDDETGFKMVPENGCPLYIPGGEPPDYVSLPMSQGEAFNPITPLLPFVTPYQSPPI